MDVEGIIAKAGGTVELAELLGVDRTTVLTWKRDGLIPGSRIGQIFDALGISPIELATITYPPRGGRVA